MNCTPTKPRKQKTSVPTARVVTPAPVLSITSDALYALEYQRNEIIWAHSVGTVLAIEPGCRPGCDNLCLRVAFAFQIRNGSPRISQHRLVLCEIRCGPRGAVARHENGIHRRKSESDLRCSNHAVYGAARIVVDEWKVPIPEDVSGRDDIRVLEVHQEVSICMSMLYKMNGGAFLVDFEGTVSLEEIRRPADRLYRFERVMPRPNRRWYEQVFQRVFVRG